MIELRVDKLFWAARFLTSRTPAAEAGDGGKADPTGEAARPWKLIRPDDLVTVLLPFDGRTVRVRRPGTRAVPPPGRVRPADFRPRGAVRFVNRERRVLDRVTRRS